MAPLPKDIVRLTAEERTKLEDPIRTGKRAASVLIHARILLEADAGAAGPGWDDDRIAEAVECGASTDIPGPPGVGRGGSGGGDFPLIVLYSYQSQRRPCRDSPGVVRSCQHPD